MSSTSDNPKLRSSTKPFSFKTQCFLCGEEASIEKESKKPLDRRIVVHKVEQPNSDRIVRQALIRGDEWGAKVKERVENVDLVAVDAVFHHACSLRFFNKGTGI